ncbi:MAG: AAA family ATPase [Planctomycetaceae bacterium]
MIASTAIPVELRGLRQWCLWKTVERGGEKTKLPFQPSGEAAKSNDPSTWATYPDVSAKANGYDGPGFMLTPPYVGIDLDGCRNAETGGVEPWAQEIIQRCDSYSEVSPSGTGVKIFCGGNWPFPNGKKVPVEANHVCDKLPGIEVYQRGRYFAVTGKRLAEVSPNVEERQDAIDWLVAKYFTKPLPTNGKGTSPQNGAKLHAEPSVIDRARAYLATLPHAISGQSGHNRTFHAACCLVEKFGIVGDDALALLQEWNITHCDPRWSDPELRHKIASAEQTCTERGTLLKADKPNQNTASITNPDETSGDDEIPQIECFTFEQLQEKYPTLHSPILDGLLREREVLNIVSVSKVGKSWLTYGLALSIVTGRNWFGRFPTSPGRVLIIDNELHRPTLAHRIAAVAEAMGISVDQFAENIEIWPMRGKARSIVEISVALRAIEPGTFKLIAVDAKYRCLPGGTSENDNAAETSFYNTVDSIAELTGAAVALIHHSTKGSQTDKRITDVGAGAGAQSRAADSHLVLREHEEADAVVLEAAVRSFAQVQPLTLRWAFPLWVPDDTLDPAMLKRSKTLGDAKQDDRDSKTDNAILKALETPNLSRKQLRVKTGFSADRMNRGICRLLDANKIQPDKEIIKGQEYAVFRKTLWG